MLSAVLVASIAVAVILGYKTKINTGFFCIAFAYLIGCFGMGLKTKELIGFWPVSTMFVILSVSLFYNFAAVNGTLEKMSASLLYMCRKFPGMLPFALFFVAVVLSVIGERQDLLYQISEIPISREGDSHGFKRTRLYRNRR